MNALRLIITREYISRVKTKAFILTTILTPFLFVLIIGLPSYLMSVNDTNIKTVYVIDNTNRYHHLFESSDTYQFVHIDNGDKKEKMDALLQINGDLSEYPMAATFFSEQQQPPRDLVKYINDVLTNAVKTEKVDRFTQESEIDPQVAVNLQQLLKSKERININTMRWSDDGTTKDTLGEVASATGIVFTFAMMMFIMVYGSWVIQSVIEEKSNRIVEVIISSVNPFDLMMGKIIGIALTGITQLLIWLALGLATAIGIGLFMTSNAPDMDVSNVQDIVATMNNNPALGGKLAELASVNWLQVGICFILYFIGGYLLFASMFAMFGSAANDAQEAQQLTAPLMVILFIAFYSGYTAARNPEGSIAFWCSLIPFTSPVAMMVRTPFEVPIWQLALSLILLYASVVLMTKLAAKIYRIGILTHGKKISFWELIKWVNYK